MTPLVYIAGPMTGYTNLNRGLFFAVEESLRLKGIGAINPARLNPVTRSWAACMVVCLWHLRLADAVALLPGWERSRGARWEVAAAVLLGLPLHLVTLDPIRLTDAPPTVIH